MFRWKLLHFILPCNYLLCRWKIVSNELCSFCNVTEDYEHFFFKCHHVTDFINEMYKLLSFIGYGKHLLNVKCLVLGYKIDDNAYYDINELLTIVYFSIYKSYFQSNKRTKNISILSTFKKEITSYIEISKNPSKILWKTNFYLSA